MTTKTKESVTTEDVAPLLGDPTTPAEPTTPAAADSVPEEFKADVEHLAEIEAEAQALRDKLAEAGVVIALKPHAPSFGMSEGTREELARTGKAVDPFTGAKLTRDDLKT
jgi:hypothetical protein